MAKKRGETGMFFFGNSLRRNEFTVRILQNKKPDIHENPKNLFSAYFTSNNYLKVLIKQWRYW